MQPPLVKFCGLRSEADVAAANAAAPDFAGFVIDVPGKWRSITLEQAIALARQLDPAIRPVGVFVNAPVETVNRWLGESRKSAVQLHGKEDAAYVAQLRRKADLVPIPRANPQDARIIQAFRIHAIADTLQAASSTADLVLLDGGAGDGKPFDWRLLTGFPRPFLLAGGLEPKNLSQAIAQARKAADTNFAGVDMSSSLETNHRKDPAKMLATMQALQAIEAQTPT